MLLSTDCLPPFGRGRGSSASAAVALRALPRLGCVWCQTRAPQLPTEVALVGVSDAGHGSTRVNDARVTPGLISIAALRVLTQVDSDGPRECLQLLAADGSVQVAVWLVPDTDFLAWDQLVTTHAAAESIAVPPVRCLDRLARRWLGARPRWAGQGVRFDHRRVGGTSLTGMTPQSLSSIGCRHAERIAALTA